MTYMDFFRYLVFFKHGLFLGSELCLLVFGNHMQLLIVYDNRYTHGKKCKDEIKTEVFLHFKNALSNFFNKMEFVLSKVASV